MKVNQIGVIAFKKNVDTQQTIKRLVLWCEKNGVSISLHPQTPFDFAQKAKSVDEFLEKSDIVASVGGDGTFISAAHISNFEKTLIGINMGKIGFFADIEIHNLEQKLQNILNGQYRVISRMIIEVKHLRAGKILGAYSAVNDVYFNRLSIPKLSSFSLSYDGDFIADYVCDGIIIASPSGSTAYSLAAGGPIVSPDMSAYIITPICPHSLSERPIILPSNKSLKIRVNEKNPEILLSVDGRENIRLIPEDEIEVCCLTEKKSLKQFSQETYFDLLRRKLGWGNSIQKIGG